MEPDLIDDFQSLPAHWIQNNFRNQFDIVFVIKNVFVN